MAYDLLIKGGTLIDPAQGINGPMDVAITGAKVAAVAKDISDFAAIEVVDATGLIVTPGLIDLHVHVFWGASHYGIEPDGNNVAKGVTTALDAGSAGARTFPAFRRYVLEQADTRLFALLNISAMGMISPEIGELEDIRWANIQEAVKAGRENRDYILGIKARLGRVQSADNDIEALKRALQAATILDGFVMVHVGGTKTPLLQIVDMLRAGDVVTHAYHGNSHGILDNTGQVKDGFAAARDRGVIFDVGHGRGSFSFDVADKALSQGFYPGNISSDLHVYNIEGPVHDQLTTLSKFLHLGLPLEDVIRLSTETTAKAMGMDGNLGTLKVGAEADVTLVRLAEGKFAYEDSLGMKAEGTQRLEHALTIRGGRVYKPWLH